MVKKSILLAALFAFIFLMSGCTLAGGAMGFAQGAKEGFKQDVKGVNAADAWIKENLW